MKPTVLILALAVLAGCAGDTRTPSQAAGDFLLGFAGHPPARRAAVAPAPVAQGSTVYSARECVGAVVNGQCQGTILPRAAYHETCHGAWVGGQCTGPQF